MTLAIALLLAAAHPPAFAIEASCSGGIAGRLEAARIDSDGRVSARTGWRSAMKPVARIPAAQALALSRQLDRAGFDTLDTLPGRPVADGVRCTITRVSRIAHTVGFQSFYRGGPVYTASHTAVRRVLSDVLAAARPPRAATSPTLPSEPSS